MDIFFGFDIGDNTGYAVTDENYHVVKYHGRKAWGVRMFTPAETAKDRRLFRTARRRLARRRYRITLLQDIFASEIAKQDENFLIRLNENDLHLSDRKIKEKYSLFNDQNFTDKQYYKKYPTIYHLRKHLLENEPEDIRLLYLAVHHIIKYRGNFLREGSLGDCVDAKKYFDILNEDLVNLSDEIANMDKESALQYVDIGKFDIDHLEELNELVKRKDISKKEKIARAKDLLNANNKEKKL